MNLKAFVVGFLPSLKNWGDTKLVYTDASFQVLQLVLYLLSFATIILIFLYIALERPEEKKKAEEEEE